MPVWVLTSALRHCCAYGALARSPQKVFEHLCSQAGCQSSPCGSACRNAGPVGLSELPRKVILSQGTCNRQGCPHCALSPLRCMQLCYTDDAGKVSALARTLAPLQLEKISSSLRPLAKPEDYQSPWIIKSRSLLAKMSSWVDSFLWLFPDFVRSLVDRTSAGASQQHTKALIATN